MKVICENVTPDGKGIFEINKKRVYVPGVLKGEEVEIEKVKRYELRRIITKSPLRVEVKCPQFETCGGCQYLHISYENELNEKAKYLKWLFNRDVKITKMENSLGYRNKVQYTFKESKRHQLALGLYKEGTHDIITIEECKLHHPKAEMIAKEVLKILNKYKLKAYDEDDKKGILRHMLIRYSEVYDKALITLVIASEVLPKRKEIVKDIIALNMGVETIVENYNFRNTSIVLGEKEKVIYGPGHIRDRILDYDFLVGSKTFYQINHEGVEKLYAKALEKAGFKKTDVIIDAYSGVGTIGLLAAKSVKEVISIELNKDSIKAANVNAKINNIKNINFILADATSKLNEFCLTKRKYDAIIMDPPRDGSTPQFINAIKKLNIPKVIYISCEPQTLKRDLEHFESNGYKIESLEAVDMFPRTFNIESICTLSRKD